MIVSSYIRPSDRGGRGFPLLIFAIGIFCAAVFIASCGDEGDTTENTTGMTDILQPTTTTPETQPPPVVGEPPDGGVVEEPVVEEPVVEEPVVEEPRVSFKDDIQPILAERCAVPGCHVAGHFTGLDLSQYDAFKQGGNGGAAFTAGDGGGSLVVKRIDGTQPPQMPPGGAPLDADQIQLFIDWIDEGGENN